MAISKTLIVLALGLAPKPSLMALDQALVWLPGGESQRAHVSYDDQSSGPLRSRLMLGSTFASSGGFNVDRWDSVVQIDCDLLYGGVTSPMESWSLINGLGIVLGDSRAEQNVETVLDVKINRQDMQLRYYLGGSLRMGAWSLDVMPFVGLGRMEVGLDYSGVVDSSEERSGTLFSYGGKLVGAYRMGRWEYLAAGTLQVLQSEDVLPEAETGWSLALGVGHSF